MPRPSSSFSSLMATPERLTERLYQVPSLGAPSMMRALMPSLASICAAVPPELLSLMPPVSGLLAPAESRPELAAGVPVRRPGAKQRMFWGPRGWQVGGTSAATMVEVRPRPPRPAQAAGTASILVLRSVMFTRKILSMC